MNNQQGAIDRIEFVTVKLVSEFVFMFRPSFCLTYDGKCFQASSYKYGAIHTASSWTELLEQLIDFSDPLEMHWLALRGIGF